MGPTVNLILHLLAITSIKAWVEQEPAEYDKDTEMCILSDGTQVKPDEKWYDSEACVAYECTQDEFGNESDYLKYTFGCEEVEVANTNPNRHCKLDTNSGNYPECCPKPVCERIE